jgi:hypothetical protein
MQIGNSHVCAFAVRHYPQSVSHFWTGYTRVLRSLESPATISKAVIEHDFWTRFFATRSDRWIGLNGSGTYDSDRLRDNWISAQDTYTSTICPVKCFMPTTCIYNDVCQSNIEESDQIQTYRVNASIVYERLYSCRWDFILWGHRKFLVI